MNNRASLQLGGDNWAAKDGNLLAYKSSLSEKNFFPIEFDFSRGADIAATRVNSSGLIEKYRENTQLYTNNLSNLNGNEYGSNEVNISTSQADPFGNSEAILLTPTETNSYHRWYKLNATSTGVKTASIYVKPNGYTNVHFFCDDNNQSATFSLIGNGSITAQHAQTINATITPVGNDGWYRISHTINATSTKWWGIYIGTGTGAYVGDGTSGVYFYGFQVERGLAATSYLESGATTGKAGVLDNLPRINYSGSTPSLLLEPSRTNVWEYSEYLDYSFDSVSSVTITQNTTETLSPEGLYNATKLEGVGPWSLRDFIAGTDTGTWTISCYIKAVNASSNNTFRLSVGGNNYSNNLTATSEWQRFDLTITNGGATAAGILRDSSTNDADLYIYGMQVEEGSYPTSYIPTYGTVDERVADICDRGADLAYTGAYTLFMEFELTKDAVYFLTNTSLAYRLFLERDDAYFKLGSSNVFFQSMFDWEANLGTNIKMAFTKSGTTAIMYVNGTKYTPSTNTLSTGNEILDWRYLDYSTTTDRQEQAYVKQLLEFKESLSDDELATLTT